MYWRSWCCAEHKGETHKSLTLSLSNSLKREIYSCLVRPIIYKQQIIDIWTHRRDTPTKLISPPLVPLLHGPNTHSMGGLLLHHIYDTHIRCHIRCQYTILIYDTHIRCPYTMPIYDTHIRCPYTIPIYDTHIRCPYTMPIYEIYIQRPHTTPIYHTHIIPHSYTILLHPFPTPIPHLFKVINYDCINI